MLPSVPLNGRMRVLDNPRLSQPLGVSGLTGIAGALVAALSGKWALAAACGATGAAVLWLVGGFTFPRSPRSCYARAARLVLDFAGLGEQADASLRHQRASLAKRLARLRPPVECKPDHSRMLELLAEGERLAANSRESYVERWRRAVVIARELHDLRQQVARRARAQHPAYAAQLFELADESETQRERSSAQIEDAGERLISKLTRMHVPSAIRHEHEMLVSAIAVNMRRFGHCSRPLAASMLAGLPPQRASSSSATPR